MSIVQSPFLTEERFLALITPLMEKMEQRIFDRVSSHITHHITRIDKHLEKLDRHAEHVDIVLKSIMDHLYALDQKTDYIYHELKSDIKHLDMKLTNVMLDTPTMTDHRKVEKRVVALELHLLH